MPRDTTNTLGMVAALILTGCVVAIAIAATIAIIAWLLP